MRLSCKRTRRSFLKAALGCGLAVYVPGVLLPEKKRPLDTIPLVFKHKPTVAYCTWYKPGIWMMPRDVASGIKGMVVIHAEKDFVFLKMDNDAWAIRDANNPGSPLAKEV